MAEFHREDTPTLGHGSELGGVAEHLGQGHLGLDLGLPAVHGLTLDLSTAGGEIADDGPKVILGNFNFDFHHRLKQHRIALFDAVLESHGAGDLERHLGGVDVVVLAVDQARRHRLADRRRSRGQEGLRGPPLRRELIAERLSGDGNNVLYQFTVRAAGRDLLAAAAVSATAAAVAGMPVTRCTITNSSSSVG